MTKLENALIWLYVKTWGKFGDNIIKEIDLWNFDDVHLERAIMSIAYPRKKEKRERVKDLTKLIMEKFEDGGLAAFREWSGEIHDQVIESLPRNVEFDAVDEQVMDYEEQLPVVKILEWDPTSTYAASVTNGIFKRLDPLAYARASTVMSTQSVTNFEWSVKLIGCPYFGIGIASKLNPGSYICDDDQEAIMVDAYNGADVGDVDIKRGHGEIYSDLKKPQTEDVIHFKFQSGTKTLVIEWNGRYEIDLEENVNYFPVIQSYGDTLEAHLIP